MIESLLVAHRERAFMAALAILRNPDDAADAVQEASARSLSRASSYDPKRPFYPWFHRIVRNYCFDVIKRRSRRREVADGEPVLDRAAAKDETDARLIRSERDAALYRALEGLTDQHREMIELRHFQDLSYEEMAEVVGVPVGTVMSRLYRARKAMQAALDADPSWRSS